MTTTQADLIRTARERAGLGVAALAREIDKSHGYISRVESGDAKVTHPGTVAALARALDLDPDAIYCAGDLIPPDIRAAVTALDPAGLARLREYLGVR